MSGAVLRRATPQDADAVMALQAQAYGPALLEPHAVMARRLAADPGRCWLAQDAQGPCAYLLAHLSKLGQVTALGADFEPVADPDSLHLHDLAVAPRAAGQGLGARLVALALRGAADAGLAWSSLVAVQGSQAFWAARGYAPQAALSPQAATVLAGYGQAVYMARAVPPR
jgi:ribosomal protein S18 acetylase RimI-like enzyme